MKNEGWLQWCLKVEWDEYLSVSAVFTLMWLNLDSCWRWSNLIRLLLWLLRKRKQALIQTWDRHVNCLQIFIKWVRVWKENRRYLPERRRSPWCRLPAVQRSRWSSSLLWQNAWAAMHSLPPSVSYPSCRGLRWCWVVGKPETWHWTGDKASTTSSWEKVIRSVTEVE